MLAVERRALTALVLAVAALAALAPTAAAQPRLEARDGALWLTALPPILDGESIERQLTSGLTTGFVFTLEVDRETRGAAQVEIRYELWDEVFLTARLEAGRADERRETVGSRPALDRWWRTLDLRLGSLPGAGSGADGEVHLVIVPFSQAEETETRRWFAESVRRAESTGSGDSASLGGGGGLDRVLTTLIGTSIRRRPLVEYRWAVEIPDAVEMPQTADDPEAPE